MCGDKAVKEMETCYKSPYAMQKWPSLVLNDNLDVLVKKQGEM